MAEKCPTCSQQIPDAATPLEGLYVHVLRTVKAHNTRLADFEKAAGERAHWRRQIPK